ncbi:head maturation protease, ClpP-related, partial [Anaerosalibacter massiliensis]|uniref:head maturation protease, ClpP-related n=1 Tax=Anaerosalibacter massiliensis TaxID=1347392 RepID=UPI0005B29610
MAIKTKIPQIENKFVVKNEASSDTATLYLHGTIGDGFWDYGEDNIVTSKRVKKALENLEGKNINLHINSGGGDVFESIAISNMLKQYNGKINVIIDSLAGSGASIVAMAGDTIQMFPNSMMMIHRAWTFVAG